MEMKVPLPKMGKLRRDPREIWGMLNFFSMMLVSGNICTNERFSDKSKRHTLFRISLSPLSLSNRKIYYVYMPVFYILPTLF